MQENKVRISDLMSNRFDVYYYGKEFIELVNAISSSSICFKKLEDITVLITDGAHQSPSSDNKFSYKYVTVKDIDNFGNIDLNNCNKISEEDFMLMTQNGCKPEAGDILFSKDGTVGKTYRVRKDDNFVILSSLAILRPDLNQISSEYLECIMQNDVILKLIKRLVGGSAIQRIVLDNLKKILIPVPNSDVQNNIVKLMSEANKKRYLGILKSQDLIDLCEQKLLEVLNIQIQNKKNESNYRSSISNILGKRIDVKYHQPKYQELEKCIKNNDKKIYLLESLDNICEEVISGQRPKGGVSQITEGIPSIGGEHVYKDGTIAVNNLKYIPEDFHNEQLKSKIKPLDIILVKDGATTGKVGIIPENYPFKDANINEHVFILRCKDNINPYYLLTFLMSDMGQMEIEREISGATIMGITKDSLKNILIPIPSVSIQNIISDEYKKCLEQAEQLKSEANSEYEKAKQRVENIILGKESL